LLVAVRGVNHDRQFDFLGELDLRAEIFVLQRGLLVIAELAHRDDALLRGEMRKDVHHGLGQRLVVRLLRIEPDAAVMPHAELAGAEFLEANDGGEVVDIAADIGARLAEPERGFDHRDDAGARHRLIVVGGARDHVRVRVDEHGAGGERQGAPCLFQLQPRAAVVGDQAHARSAARTGQFQTIPRAVRAVAGLRLLAHGSLPSSQPAIRSAERLPPANRALRHRAETWLYRASREQLRSRLALLQVAGPRPRRGGYAVKACVRIASFTAVAAIGPSGMSRAALEMNSGPVFSSLPTRPCEPFTRFATDGITSISARNPSARRASRKTIASLGERIAGSRKSSTGS